MHITDYHTETDTYSTGNHVLDVVTHHFTFEGPIDRDLFDWLLEHLCRVDGFGLRYARHMPGAMLQFSTEDADFAVLTKLTWGGAL